MTTPVPAGAPSAACLRENLPPMLWLDSLWERNLCALADCLSDLRLFVTCWLILSARRTVKETDKAVAASLWAFASVLQDARLARGYATIN